MPDVPADLKRRLGSFYIFVDGRIGLAKAVGPKHLPGKKFRIAQHQTPKRDIVSINRPLALMCRGNEFLQFEKALTRAVWIDAAFLCLGNTELAETSDMSAFGATVTSSEHV